MWDFSRVHAYNGIYVAELGLVPNIIEQPNI